MPAAMLAHVLTCQHSLVLSNAAVDLVASQIQHIDF